MLCCLKERSPVITAGGCRLSPPPGGWWIFDCELTIEATSENPKIKACDLVRIFIGFRNEGARCDGDEGMWDNMSRRPNKRKDVGARFITPLLDSRNPM